MRHTEVFTELTKLEKLARSLGLHVALTGSMLYGMGKGARKDLDVIVYRHGGKNATIEDAQDLAEAACYFIRPGVQSESGQRVLVCELPKDRRQRIDFITHTEEDKEDGQ